MVKYHSQMQLENIFDKNENIFRKDPKNWMCKMTNLVGGQDQGCPLERTFRHLHNLQKSVKIGVQISLLQTMVLSVNRLNLDMKMLFLTDKCSFWWQNHKMLMIGGWYWVWLNFESYSISSSNTFESYGSDRLGSSEIQTQNISMTHSTAHSSFSSLSAQCR